MLRRNFSSTPRAQIRLEDDDDPEPPKGQNGSLRPKYPGVHPSNNVDLRQLISSRAPKPKPFIHVQPKEPPKRREDPPPPNPLELRRQYFDRVYTSLEARISKSAQRNGDIQRQFGERVATAIETFEMLVSRSSAACRSLEQEYCSIKFRETPKLRNRLLQIGERNANLIHDYFSLMIERSQAFTSDLSQKLEVEYLAPQRSARDKIDTFIGNFDEIYRKYDEFRAKEVAVGRGLRELQELYYQLSFKLVRRNRDHKRMKAILREDLSAFAVVAHRHRIRWLRLEFALNPVLKSAEPRQSLDFDSATAKLSPGKIVGAFALDDRAHRRYRRTLEEHKNSRISAAKAFYMMRWNGPKRADDPTMDIHWRQLDLMAPFDVVLAGHWLLIEEVWLLLSALEGKFGPMWDPLLPAQVQDHCDRIRNWVVKFREDQRLFLLDCKRYRYINYYRLQVEAKLHQVGEPNFIRARGLFVPLNPLSQNHARFGRWVAKLGSIMSDAWYSRMMVQVTKRPAMQEQWLNIINRYHEIERLKSNPVIQDLGSVRTKRKRGRRALPMPALRSSTRRAARRPKFGMTGITGYLAHKSKRGSSASSAKKPTAYPSNSFWGGLSSRRTPSAASSGPDDINARMETSMSTPKRSTKSGGSRGPLDQKSKPKNSFTPASPKTMKKKDRVPDHKFTSAEKVPESAKENHRKGDRPAPKNRQKTAAPAARKNSHSDTRKASVSKPSRSRLEYRNLKPSDRRSYCTDPCASRDLTRECSRRFLPGQTPGVPAIAEVAELSSQSVKKVIRSDQTVSSIVESHTKVVAAPSFWSHSLYRQPDGQKIVVHYCRSLADAERIAQLFLNSRVIGFDMEWKAQAAATDSIQNNLSLIQIANEERIALFQIALFKPCRNLQDLAVPSIKRILELPDITKVGVAIKADATRLRKYLGIEAQSIFELSHLYKLVKHGLTNPKLVNKRAVNLSEQIEEHFGIPLEKNDDVRCGDWTRPLNYRQIQCALAKPVCSTGCTVYTNRSLDRCRH